MGYFLAHRRHIQLTILSLAVVFICNLTISAQSLFEIINQAKNYRSDDPKTTERSNVKQQLTNLYKIIPVIKSSEHNDTIGLLYYYISYRHNVLNEMQKVKTTANISLDYLKQSDYDDYMIPFCYFFSARANKLLGYEEEAIKDIKSIFNLNLKGRGFEVLGDAQRLMAAMYREKGDHESALSQFNYFLNSKLADSLNAYSKARILLDVSLSHSSFHDSLSIQKALQAVEESNQFLPKIPYKHQQADVKFSNSMQIGFIHYSHNNYDLAIEAYENILNLIDKSTENLNFKRYYITALANLIELYGRVEKYTSIDRLIRQHQLILPNPIDIELQDSYALLFENLSTYYRYNNEYAKAQQCLTSAFTCIQATETQAAYQQKTNLYKQRLTKLLGLKIELNKTLFQGKKDSSHLLIALHEMYKLDSLIDFVNQELLFESSILNWRQEAKSFYNLGIDIAYALNDKNAFWTFSEKAKSLALLEGMSNDKLFLNNESITKSVQQLRELQLLESNLQQQLLEISIPVGVASLQSEITSNKNKQNTILIERNSIFQKQIPETISLGDIQSTLDKATLIQYVVTENNIFAMLVNQNQSFLYKLGPSADIENKITSFRKQLNDTDDSGTNFENISLLLKDLHTLLIAPFGELNQNLIIIPEDFLFLLPFESLLNDKGRYLIENFTINYQLSASLRNQTQQSHQLASKQTTIVSPEYFGIAFSPLTHAQQEAEIVQSLTGGELFTTISKKELISQYTNSDIFHFSGHAMVNESFQNNSFLSLSDTSQLSESEIYNYPNHLNMVVLSGCDTGAGTILKGEGISNLTRAFIYAGAKSVLQSLWSIDDQASQTLIQYFYEELKKGNPKSQALREAKLNYLNTVDDFHKHPYYWSAFVLVGDDAALTFSSAGTQRLYLFALLGLACIGLFFFFFKRRSKN